MNNKQNLEKLQAVIQMIDNCNGLLLEYSNNKRKYAGPNCILIDDRDRNIEQWISSGGIGILHKDYDTTISELEKLGL